MVNTRALCGRLFAALVASGALSSAAVAMAQNFPPPVELPAVITLDDALRIFRRQSFDLLIAEATVRSAQGDELAARAIQNPAASFSYGRALGFTCKPEDTGCSESEYIASLSDQAAIENSVTGKRQLRVKVATHALAAARMSRADGQRNLEFALKQQYLQTALAYANLEFAREVQRFWGETAALAETRYTLGAINLGDLAKIRTAQLGADQGVDSAVQNIRAQQAALALLLGVRGKMPNFMVDANSVRGFSVPAALGAATEDTLLKHAFEHRPDLLVYGYQRQRAEAAVALARRLRFPDIAASVNYVQMGTGNGAIQPPTLSFGLSAPLPLFYQQQGEIRRAEADLTTQSAQRAKVEAQVVADVATAYASYATSRRIVERMRTSLLEQAKVARDITERQFKAGAASSLEFLDAERTYIGVNYDYLQNLTNYWTAVAQLEQAVGTDLRR